MLGSLGFAGFNLLSYVGLEHTQPQNAALIVALQPLVTAVALWITTRQLPARATFVAMAVALFGVTLVITARQARHAAERRGPRGRAAGADRLRVVDRLHARRAPLRGLLAAALHGAERHVRHDHDLRRHRDRGRASAASTLPSPADVGAVWWHTLYIIAAGAVIAVLAWNEGVRRIGPANAALFLNLVPIISFAIAIAIQGYDPNVFELLGALITIGALVYANLAGRDQAITRPSRLAWAATRRELGEVAPVELASQAELPDTELVGTEVVRQLVAHRARRPARAAGRDRARSRAAACRGR